VKIKTSTSPELNIHHHGAGEQGIFNFSNNTFFGNILTDLWKFCQVSGITEFIQKQTTLHL